MLAVLNLVSLTWRHHKLCDSKCTTVYLVYELFVYVSAVTAKQQNQI